MEMIITDHQQPQKLLVRQLLEQQELNQQGARNALSACGTAMRASRSWIRIYQRCAATSRRSKSAHHEFITISHPEGAREAVGEEQV
jgi:hypothetical protein